MYAALQIVCVLLLKDEAKKGCEILTQCEALIDKLGLFSPNEQKDDVSTGNLKYLLVSVFLAQFSFSFSCMN